MRIKKQWILVLGLAVVLAVAVLLASQIGKAPQDNHQDTTTESSSEEEIVFQAPAITYEEYQAMTGEERDALLKQFPSNSVFTDWVREIRAEYEEHKMDNAIDGDNVIDLNDITGNVNG